MSTWDDKPNDYEHAIAEIERLRAALRDLRKVAADSRYSNELVGIQTRAYFEAWRALEQSASEAKK